MVVDADHHLALAAAHGLGHRLVLLKAEGDAIAFSLPVGRVRIEEGMGTVILGQALQPGQVLHQGAGSQAQMGGREVLLDAEKVDRWRGGGRAKALPFNLPPKA